MKSWLWWLHRTSTSWKEKFLEANLEVQSWQEEYPQEMFNLVFLLMCLFQGCWYCRAFWAGGYQTSFVTRWVIHPLLSFPVRASLSQDQHLSWMVPTESCVASSWVGCWCVQNCHSFAFTCSFLHKFAQGAESKEQHQMVTKHTQLSTPAVFPHHCPQFSISSLQLCAWGLLWPQWSLALASSSSSLLSCLSLPLRLPGCSKQLWLLSQEQSLNTHKPGRLK